jgi:hypothetical protein
VTRPENIILYPSIPPGIDFSVHAFSNRLVVGSLVKNTIWYLENLQDESTFDLEKHNFTFPQQFKIPHCRKYGLFSQYTSADFYYSGL